MPANTASTSSSAISRIAQSEPKKMTSAERVKYYTAKLVLGENPAKALQRLYAVGVTMKPFDDANTEKALEKYENDSQLRGIVGKLREKFASMRRREARNAQNLAKNSKMPAVAFDKKAIEDTKKQEREISQFDVKDLFAGALKKIGHKETVSKPKMDYSKFKVVKRAQKPSPPPAQISTPKRTIEDRARRSCSNFSTSSGSSSSNVSP